MCVDGSPINLYQKPGWHREGFFNCKSRYLLSAQVCVLSIEFDMLTYLKRLLFFHTTSGLLTMSLESLEVFTTRMLSLMLAFTATQRPSLEQRSGSGQTLHTHPFPGALSHSSGRTHRPCPTGRRYLISRCPR